MANFDAAYQKTAAHEGGYVNDPDDAGAETYKGISRRFNPSWIGWAKIDEMKVNVENFSQNLEGDAELQ